MKVDIKYRPACSMSFINLGGGEEVRVEGGSMVSMSNGVSIETDATGGLLSAISRKIFGGESFFHNTFQAPAGAVRSSSPHPCPATCQFEPERPADGVSRFQAGFAGGLA